MTTMCTSRNRLDSSHQIWLDLDFRTLVVPQAQGMHWITVIRYSVFVGGISHNILHILADVLNNYQITSLLLFFPMEARILSIDVTIPESRYFGYL